MTKPATCATCGQPMPATSTVRPKERDLLRSDPDPASRWPNMSAARDQLQAEGNPSASQETDRTSAQDNAGPLSGDFEQCVRQLCVRLGVQYEAPDIIRWAWIGVHLALLQPEFTLPKRRPGRPKGSIGPTAEPDAKVLKLIETVMGTRPESFDEILPIAIAKMEESGHLPAHVERTTHRKRLRRHWKKRRQNDRTLAELLLYHHRDKKRG